MTALIWLLPVAALALGLRLRSGRIRRLTALVDDLTAQLKKADAHRDSLKADLATQDANADRLHRLARQALAERDGAHMEAARTLRRVWALQADNERLVGWEQAQLDAAVSTVEDGLREIGAGT